MKKVKVYHTHIEISPYAENEIPALERTFSVWDDANHSYNQMGMLFFDNTLYLPRGADLSIIKRNIQNCDIVTVKDCDKFDKIPVYMMDYNPRDIIQEESCNFLVGSDRFKSTRKYSQLGLSLDTGDGKTFCTVKSILDLRMKAIIITHADKIKQQWIDTCSEMSNIPEDRLVNISGVSMIDKIMSGKVEGDIYFINHQTLNSYMRNRGYDELRKFFTKLKVGIKVIDEVHLSFRNTVLIDMFSNVKKTIYLSANFSRSDVKEKILFDKVFKSITKFGEETKNYECKRKHIIYLPTFYDSRASSEEVFNMKNYYGFSANAFIDYALWNDTSSALEYKLIEIYDKVKSLDGKILITSPKIASVDKVIDIIKKHDPEISIGSIYSKNDDETNENTKKECRVISSTLKSCGTGTDIGGLRVVINMEPYSSNITANQLAGRLREFSETEDTFYFDLIDISVPRCYEMYKTRLKFLKTKCKKIVTYDK